MKKSDIAYHRLYNQQVLKPKFLEPSEVLSWMGAIQGQDYPGAKWSLGLRIPGTIDKDIEKAFTHKKILRTWLMRGTLFFVAANDIEWIRKLVAPKIITGNKRRYNELSLDADTLLKTNDLLVEFLKKEQLLNRTDLLALIEKRGISTEGQRAAYILQRGSLDGLICQVNMVRNSPNYVLMDNLTVDNKTFTREESINELVKRYFTSRGPATIQDFVWWSGLTLAETRLGLEANKLNLLQETIDGQIYWLSKDIHSKITNTAEVLFLPGFDEFLLGYKERDISLDTQFNTNWCPGNNGMFFPFIVQNGRATATWKREIKKNSMTIAIKPFNSKEKLIFDKNEAIRAYAKFIGAEQFTIEG